MEQAAVGTGPIRLSDAGSRSPIGIGAVRDRGQRHEPEVELGEVHNVLKHGADRTHGDLLSQCGETTDTTAQDQHGRPCNMHESYLERSILRLEKTKVIRKKMA